MFRFLHISVAWIDMVFHFILTPILWHRIRDFKKFLRVMG